MSQALANQSLSRASLRRPKPARTVLLRMAADERRAQRIRALKEGHPGVTWKQIADYVGVSERSALNWQATGEIGYPNAKRLAQFFRERGERISEEYVWRGDHEPPTNLLPMPNPEPSQPNIIEALLREILSRLDRLDELADQLVALEERFAQARREDLAHDMVVLRRIEEGLSEQRRQPPQEPPS